MKLTGNDLKQINDTALERLSQEQLLLFTKRLLIDYKEAMDRLNQNPNNSSRPPSSAPPWGSSNTPSLTDQDSADDVENPENKHFNDDNDDLPPEDKSSSHESDAQDTPDVHPPQ